MKQTRFISEEEKQTIRAARKIMKKLAKQYARLREKSSYVNCEHYKMYKELTKLKIDVGIDSSEYEESIQLSLNSGMYGYSTEIF